jgi:HK97 family phage prohead protease
MSNGLTYKSFSGTSTALDEATGEIEAIVNSLSVEDLQRDVMHVGCWSAVIADMQAGRKSWPSLIWAHEWHLPVGKVVYAEERGNSLYIKGRFNLRTTRGRDAFEDVRFGSIKEFSVGFLTNKDGEHYDNKGVRHVTKVAEWPEVSCVLVGASPGTHALSIKAATTAVLSDEVFDAVLLQVESEVQEELTDFALRKAEERRALIKRLVHDELGRLDVVSETPQAWWTNEQRFAWTAEEDFQNPRRAFHTEFSGDGTFPRTD